MPGKGLIGNRRLGGGFAEIEDPSVLEGWIFISEDYASILYSSIFRYNVVSPMPINLAASVLFLLV